MKFNSILGIIRQTSPCRKTQNSSEGPADRNSGSSKKCELSSTPTAEDPAGTNKKVWQCTTLLHGGKKWEHLSSPVPQSGRLAHGGSSVTRLNEEHADALVCKAHSGQLARLGGRMLLCRASTGARCILNRVCFNILCTFQPLAFWTREAKTLFYKEADVGEQSGRRSLNYCSGRVHAAHTEQRNTFIKVQLAVLFFSIWPEKLKIFVLLLSVCSFYVADKLKYLWSLLLPGISL